VRLGAPDVSSAAVDNGSDFVTDQDFVDIVNFARARGAVVRQLHPLLYVVTTPEYAEAAPGLAAPVVEAGALPLTTGAASAD
jgi:hypothetical protein